MVRASVSMKSITWPFGSPSISDPKINLPTYLPLSKTMQASVFPYFTIIDTAEDTSIVDVKL